MNLDWAMILLPSRGLEDQLSWFGSNVEGHQHLDLESLGLPAVVPRPLLVAALLAWIAEPPLCLP
uniref:Uncharacterized protein n=1 Tax=Romanomermis culicivorax TaxID=13658 RepID=A0A915L9Y3_ROMCU